MEVHFCKVYPSIFFFISIFATCSGLSASQNVGPARLHEMKSSRSLTKHALTRKRRNEDTQKCQNLQDDPVRHQFALKGDHNANLKLTWVGKNSDTQLLLTTFEFGLLFFKLRAESKLYKSNDDGFTFSPVKEEIKNGDIRNDYGILKSQLNPSKILLISYSYSMKNRKSSLYISKDGTSTWSSVVIPFVVRDREPIILHPTKEDWLLALEGGGKNAAWLSTDFGFNWIKLKENADMVKWGARGGDSKEEQTIFVTVTHYIAGIFRSSMKSLWRSRDLGKSFKLIHDVIYSLGIQENFLFISLAFPDVPNTRVMHVSKDNGDHFHRVRVPEVKPDMFYAILDMSEGQVFLHVDEERDTGKGTLFISNSDGIMYTKSLENHFYTNDGITDFYKVESMRGVFLTHKLEPDKTLKSVITFDRGVTWHDLYLTDEQCKGAIKKANAKCSLHYHHTFSQFKGHVVQGPLSTATAFGIILLHGVNGDALTTNNTSVYMSRDGGYSWDKVLDGPHHYAIGDHGNLIVAVPRQNGPNTTVTRLVYSLDQGRCWNSLKFSDDPLVIKGLVTEPNSQKRTFSLWGYFKDQKTIDWLVITVNFHKIFTRKCHDDDYEYWYPHAVGRKDGCFLGLKEEYPRVKQNVMCFSGEDYKPKVTKKHCECTLEDLECDYGYEKDVLGKCIRDENVKLEICKNGHEQKLEEGKGYRRIPGDQCKGGKDQFVVNAIKYADTKKPCKPDELDSYGFSVQNKQAKHAKKSTNKGLLIFGIILVILVAVGGTIYFFRKAYLYRNSSSYRYSQLASEENRDLIEEVNGYDPRPKGLREYRDESDVESDTELLKL